MAIVAAPSQLLKGMQAVFIEALAEVAASSPVFDNAATYVSSESEDEDYAWIGDVAGLNEFVDEVQFAGLSDTSYTLTNKKFTGGLQFLRDNLNDEKTRGMHQRIMDLATRARQHSEKQLVDALINGDVNSHPDLGGGIGYDGVVFFSATHPARGDSGEQSNLVSYSGSSTANAQTDLGASVAALLKMKDESGEPLNEYAKNFYVAYPPTLHKPIAEALGAQIVSNTTNVQFAGFSWTLIQSARLEAHSAAEYYVGVNPPGGTKALIYQDREPVTLESLEDGDEAFKREVYSYKVRKRSAAGYGRWQRMVRVA